MTISVQEIWTPYLRLTCVEYNAFAALDLESSSSRGWIEGISASREGKDATSDG